MVRTMPCADSFSGIYTNLKVLVTGHTGFKGSWLTLWLKALGARVCGLSLPPPTEPSLFEVLNLQRELDCSVFSDIRDYARVKSVVDSFRPELIFHLAAQPLVRRSYSEPLETYETNVQGTLNVLEASRHCSSVKALVCITTDKCYENLETLRPYQEGDPLGGYDLYSSSKGCAEILCASFRRSFLNPAATGSGHTYALATARAGNVIGGGDWAEDRLIPDCARALSEEQPIVLRNPQSVRPWQHVLEPLSGYLLLGKRLLTNSFDCTPRELSKPDTLAFNFGPNPQDVLTVKQMAELFIEAWGSGELKVSSAPSVHEAKLLSLDIHKAGQVLGWRPTWDAGRAVNESAVWYQSFYRSRADQRALCLQQLEKFTVAAPFKADDLPAQDLY